MPRLVSLLGLGFGDCGKGQFTDALARRWQAHTVVRFNGGAQAGHNVVLPDGRQHTFSQFSAGTLVPDVATVLAYPVIVHPGALGVELARLSSIGVDDAYRRLLIDRRCRVTTPFHQAAGRLRELLRGSGAHGSCGVGVGETVRHALERPEEVLRYGDLARPALAMRKLQRIRCQLEAEFVAFGEACERVPAMVTEYRLLADEPAGEAWLSRVDGLLRVLPPVSPETIADRLARPGTVLFEGAQGVLLDEWRGFHPHTTWSSVHPRAVATVAADYGCTTRVEHLGVLRTYLTRHGHGPFPTADPALDVLPEPHNGDQCWQGRFRRGHPDGVLLRYALEVTGRLDGLLVSHLDAFQRVAGLRWCDAYAAPLPGTQVGADSQLAVEEVKRLPYRAREDLTFQSALTRLLFAARPLYAPVELRSPAALLDRLQQTSACPVWFTSDGAGHPAVRPWPPAVA